jgi:hypothetical protein
MSDSKEVETTIEHPLEEAFDIEPGTTISTKTERTTDLSVIESYDEKDEEIEEQFQEIYDAAMAAFEDQVAEAELIEGKYKARNMEVGVQLLNAALSAAKEKSNQKQHKDKTELAKGKLKGGGNVKNQNIFVGSHQEMMEMMKNMQSGVEEKVINPPEDED